MGLQIATITNSIAALSISGVTIKDKDELREGWTAYDCPLLTPLPNNFVSGISAIPRSMSSGAGRQLDVSYTLTYRYFHAPVGSGNLAQTWSDMVDKVFAIFDAILANDKLNGLIDLSLSSVSEFGVVVDGANNQYHGCDIALRVMEFVN